MANGRTEEAVAFLVKYHGNGDPNARLVRLEVEEMKEGIRIDGIDKRWWDCKFEMPMFSGPLSQSTNLGLQIIRPTIYHHKEWTLAFCSGYYDLCLWTMVWQWSRLLQRHYFQGYRIRVQLNAAVAEHCQLYRFSRRCALCCVPVRQNASPPCSHLWYPW